MKPIESYVLSVKYCVFGAGRRRHLRGVASTLGVIAIGLVMAGCPDRVAQQQAKETQQIISNPVKPVVATPVSLRTMSQNIEITGDVTTSNDVTVGAKNPGRLVAVYVQDGDQVRQGQVIAVQDTSNQQIQLQQALAQEASAQSGLAQARANAIMGPRKSSAAVLQAQAQLRSAQSQYKKAVAGARPEEKAQAAASVASAQSNMDTAKKTRDRQRQLLDQGAVSQQEFDSAENAYESAVSAYQNALQQQKMMQNWTRPEDIEAAREAVQQAQEGLATAKANQKLDTLFTDQVNSARAQLQSAIASVRLAQQSIADASIRAPFDGRVNGKPAQVGSVPGAGNPIAHIVGKAGTYFEGQVSENDIGKISVGSPVVVTLDSLPGKTFSGHIAAISPSASDVGRLFNVRVQLDSVTPDVKPGMFARGDVTLKRIQNATVVPTDAVVTKNGKSYVFVVESGKAHMQPVSIGLQQGGFTEVIGVAAGQQIVTSGQQDLQDNAPVEVRPASQTQANGSEKSGGAIG